MRFTGVKSEGISRLEELRYEEFSASDIIERAAEEAGVDVSGMVKDR